MPPERWFDAHLDLAYLALQGRPMHWPLSDVRRRQPGASVTFPSLIDGHICAVLATLFVQPWDNRPAAINGSWSYRRTRDAHYLANMQLDLYDQWFAEGYLQRRGHCELNTAPDAYLLMEGCNPIREIDDLNLFYGRGVRAISLTWTGANRWAAGNDAQGGLSHDGQKLLQRAGELGVILDVSHLSERAFFDVVEVYSGPIIASHSNCQTLLPSALQSPRNLNDVQIGRLVQRGGVIGINLYSKFLAAGRATLHDVVSHICHIADIGGSMNCVGLGSDMDGGFDNSALPAEFQSHADLPHLAEAMSHAGVSDEDIHRFACQNWENAIVRHLYHKP